MVDSICVLDEGDRDLVMIVLGIAVVVTLTHSGAWDLLGRGTRSYVAAHRRVEGLNRVKIQTAHAHTPAVAFAFAAMLSRGGALGNEPRPLCRSWFYTCLMV